MYDLLDVRCFLHTLSFNLHTYKEMLRKLWLFQINYLGAPRLIQDRRGTSIKIPDSLAISVLASSSDPQPFSCYSVALLRHDWNV